MLAWHSKRPRVNARGYRGKPDREKMNKTEASYADHLFVRQVAGEILDFGYQRMKLRLASLTFYEPDFDVQLANGEVEFHEVKGFWDDDARVKVKVAASLYPFRFVGVTRDRHLWKFEVF
jgi:hypothetical protein